MVKRCVGIGFVVLGLLFWGMKGLLCGAVLNQWFSYFVNMALVSKYVGYKWSHQLRDLSSVFFVSIVIAIVSYCCGLLLTSNMYYNGLIILFVYVTLYICWSFVFKPAAFDYFRSIIVPFVSKKINKHR